MRRIPIFATVIVAAAIAVMIALGFWQLGRMEEKDALIQRAERSLKMAEPVGYPRDPALAEELLYRRTEVTCAEVVGINTVASTSLRGEKGVAHRATCALPSGEQVRIDLGFSRNPAPVEWAGGPVGGTIAPGGRIVAAQGVAGLAPLAPPDPRDLPNNHLAYAGQWFFFALTALIIYILALRRRATRARDV